MFFEVDPKAKKPEIKQAIEKVFSGESIVGQYHGRQGEVQENGQTCGLPVRLEKGDHPPGPEGQTIAKFGEV